MQKCFTYEWALLSCSVPVPKSNHRDPAVLSINHGISMISKAEK